MKQKKWTQAQRISQLEKAVTRMYVMIQAIMEKLPKEENTEEKK